MYRGTFHLQTWLVRKRCTDCFASHIYRQQLDLWTHLTLSANRVFGYARFFLSSSSQAADCTAVLLQKSAKKATAGPGFSDQNKSWLKRKQQQGHSSDELPHSDDESEGACWSPAGQLIATCHVSSCVCHLQMHAKSSRPCITKAMVLHNLFCYAERLLRYWEDVTKQSQDSQMTTGFISNRSCMLSVHTWLQIPWMMSLTMQRLACLMVRHLPAPGKDCQAFPSRLLPLYVSKGLGKQAPLCMLCTLCTHHHGFPQQLHASMLHLHAS